MVQETSRFCDNGIHLAGLEQITRGFPSKIRILAEQE